MEESNRALNKAQMNLLELIETTREAVEKVTKKNAARVRRGAQLASESVGRRLRVVVVASNRDDSDRGGERGATRALRSICP